MGAPLHCRSASGSGAPVLVINGDRDVVTPAAQDLLPGLVTAMIESFLGE